MDASWTAVISVIIPRKLLEAGVATALVLPVFCLHDHEESNHLPSLLTDSQGCVSYENWGQELRKRVSHSFNIIKLSILVFSLQKNSNKF